MNINNIFTYVLKSVILGLAIAFLVITIIPSITKNSDTEAINITPSSTSDLNTLSTQAPIVNSYANAVEIAAPTVVNISTQTLVTNQNYRMSKDPFMQHLFDQLQSEPRTRLEKSLGSGVIVSQDGIILTNYHVIKNANKIEVAIHDGQVALASIIGVDPDTDLAVLKVPLNNLSNIQFANSIYSRVGDIVLAIGNPFGVGQTVTSGIISGTGRNMLGINTFEDFIQTDAAINPGNSGGALINPAGELVGINTAIISRSGGSQGIGLAIPTNLAKNVMQQILKQGYVTRGWIGIGIQNVTSKLAASLKQPKTTGVIISKILVNGPADKSGLQLNDIIIKINNKKIYNKRMVLNAISKVTPSKKMLLTVIRDNKEKIISVVADQRPP
ncbi:HtrA protease/chaperone protein [hydrothermal vent metagenome]|uniref:HtrA protease/chaperone protein n=1 Tax=hydrothermal vent metagenome TaxID=652676 RepID=A0A3B1B2F8_9ZZZZ